MADSLDMKLEIKGDEEIVKLLTGVGLDVKDLKGAMDEVGSRAIKTFSGQVFASRGGFINQSWPRLSPRYAAQKAKRYAGRPMLVRSGKMQASFTKTATNTSVTIGNSATYFKYHQSSAPRSKIPRRTMLGIYNGMQDDVTNTNTIAEALSRKIKARAS